MAVYGYHRTSTREQHLDRGIKEITDFCNQRGIVLNKIVTDQQTGKNFDRPKYQSLKEFINPGDVLIISEIDRLGRNKDDTLKELQWYKAKGVRVMILEIPTSLTEIKDDSNNNMLEMITNILIEVYTCMAHAEMQKKEKQQSEGIQAMKDRGEWGKYGRPKAIDYDVFKVEFQKVVSGQLKPFECMRQLGMTTPTFYRYKKKFESESL